MAGIKKIGKKYLQEIAGRTGFNQTFIVKDYYVTVILYMLKDVEGLYFKGGTALQKIFFDHSRLSEDIDYTVTKSIDFMKENIREILERSGIFRRVTMDKDLHDFTRMVVQYIDPFGSPGSVFIDLNRRARLVLKPELHEVSHFYAGHIPAFSVNTLNVKELAAEKMAAAIGRNKPRDHFDLYKIVSVGIPLDLGLVRKKCVSSGHEFNIARMFNKANTLKNRWDKDISPLLSEEITFHEVMKTLSRYFKHKEGKKKPNAQKPS